MDESYSKFKVLIIGDSGVGKTSLLLRHVDNRFTQDTLGTIGVDYKHKTYIKDKKRYDLNIWDTAGQERFRNVVSAYYRNAAAAFLVFDLTNKASFEHTIYWLQALRSQLGEGANPIIILVGNKIDLVDQIAVRHRDIQQFATENNLSSYIQTSAKDGAMVDKMFDQILEKLITKNNQPKHNVPQTNIVIKNKTPTAQSKCC